MGYVPQGLNPLLKLEVAKIFLHDVWHSHAQPCGEILRRHRLLLRGVLQQLHQAVCEPLTVSRRVKLDGKFLALRHLTKVGQVRTNDRYPVSAGEMRNPAASRG
jgi:hypothetical protein